MSEVARGLADAKNALNKCPKCNALVAAPSESMYLTGGILEHHWKCQGCGISWTTKIDPLSTAQ
jgi:uncharacterized protein with PIN domain